MVDYGHPISFGISIDPTSAGFAQALSLAHQADAAGLEYLAVQDHPYQPSHLDALSLMSILVDRTDRIAVVSDVLDLQLRPPTMLAKAAASLATMAGGRVHLGVGGGATGQGIAAMGGTPRRGIEMVAYTEEAIQILKWALRGEVVQISSPRHRVAGYQAGPIPLRPVEVWVGSQMPRMLAVTGRSGDGWVSPLNIYIPPEEVPARQQMIDGAARAAGREPREIRRIYNVTGAIGAFRGGNGLVGPVEMWVDTLAEWTVELGFDTFIFWPAIDAPRQLAIFTSEVVPAVRARVSDARARS
ncbi:LLM class flavin-dependent oxidoreductase [Amnibacterium flavum]|uniref:LLM class flavin-dependent oxidoreductase n=1 Tax=Amnibacterium flavum TaxID=2173173 RepID=A0A2V1HVU1_9MICO|nr:LLM class flavin-dependent oxidoreductase [Amnibacterium flavum]PVZ95229.1 LLM class flavin-dependent oxidoreductase [Amnibacterium flavum]